MIHPPIVVPVIVHRLQWDSAITALVHADDADSAIVNLLDLVAARHVSRRLVSRRRRLSEDTHAWVIVLLVLLHSHGVDLVPLPIVARALSQHLVRIICAVSCTFTWGVVGVRGTHLGETARDLGLHVVLLLN
jgi:hypothetical protein